MAAQRWRTSSWRSRASPTRPLLRNAGCQVEGREWQRGSSYPKATEQLLRTRPGKLHTTNPASSDLAQKLSQSGLTIAEVAPGAESQPKFRQMPCGPRFVCMSPHLANNWPNLTMFGQLGRIIGQPWPNLTKVTQHWSLLASTWPMLAQIGHNLANIGRCWVKVAKSWPTVATIGPTRAKLRQTKDLGSRATLGQLLGDLGANFGARRNRRGQLFRNMRRATVRQLWGKLILSETTSAYKAAPIISLAVLRS